MGTCPGAWCRDNSLTVEIGKPGVILCSNGFHRWVHLLDWEWCLLWTEDLPGTFLNRSRIDCAFSKRSKQYSSHTSSSWTLLHPIKRLSLFSLPSDGQACNCSDQQSTTEVMLCVLWYSFSLALLFCDSPFLWYLLFCDPDLYYEKPKLHEGTIWREFSGNNPS